MNPTRRRRRKPPGALTAVRFGALAPPRPGNQDSQSVRGPERHSGPRTVFPAGRTQPSHIRNRHGFQPTHSRLSRDSSRGTPRMPSSPLWRATYTHIIVLTTFPRGKDRAAARDGYEQAQGPHAGHWSNFPYGTAPQPCQQWGFGPPPSRKTSSLAICSLVFSICGWIVAWLVFLPAGIVCGPCALHSVRKTGESGEGMARAGLTLGYLGLVVTPLLLKWTRFQ